MMALVYCPTFRPVLENQQHAISYDNRDDLTQRTFASEPNLQCPVQKKLIDVHEAYRHSVFNRS
jgi:hypothetical protein